MDNLTQDYEKYINEIQFLKKQVNAEKLAHQNSLKQLHSTYQIIDQIKEMLRIQQSNNLKLKAELADKNIRITTISSQYQQQIGDIKQIINLKDEELRKMSSVLIVSDYDMIRLRVVNEVELSHKEEVQHLNMQINKRQGQMTQLRSRMTLISNKYQHLSSELKKQEQQFNDQKQQLNKKYMIQIKNLYQSTQKQRNQSHKWQKKYQLLENKIKKQTETYKEEIAKITRELEVENRAILSNTNSKSTKIKMEKLQQQFIKLKEQYNQEKQNNRRFQEENNRLKKQIKIINKQVVETKTEKENLLDQIQQIKRELQSKDRQKTKQLQKIKKQFQNTSQNISHTSKSDKQKINKLEIQNKRLAFKLSTQEEQLTILKMKPKQNNLHLIRRELDDKNEQIERLILELDNYKKKERTKSVIEKKEEQPQYKKKLNEANQKIVQLLKQKIELSRQINFLKSASPSKH